MLVGPLTRWSHPSVVDPLDTLRRCFPALAWSCDPFHVILGMPVHFALAHPALLECIPEPMPHIAVENKL